MGLPLAQKKQTEDPSIQFYLAFCLPLRNRKLICNDGGCVCFFRGKPVCRHYKERSDEAISLTVHFSAENFAEMEIATLNSKRNNKSARNDGGCVYFFAGFKYFEVNIFNLPQ